MIWLNFHYYPDSRYYFYQGLTKLPNKNHKLVQNMLMNLLHVIVFLTLLSDHEISLTHYLLNIKDWKDLLSLQTMLNQHSLLSDDFVLFYHFHTILLSLGLHKGWIGLKWVLSRQKILHTHLQN